MCLYKINLVYSLLIRWDSRLKFITSSLSPYPDRTNSVLIKHPVVLIPISRPSYRCLQEYPHTTMKVRYRGVFERVS